MTTLAPSLLERIKQRIAGLLGNSYAPTLQLVGRVFGAFAVGIATKAISMGISLPGITTMAWWHAVLFSGVGAALAAVTGLISTWLAGVPSLLGFVSNTIRAQRDHGTRAGHRVSVLRSEVIPHQGEHEVSP